MTSAEVVDCTSLASGSLVDVETRSRHYRIECHGGSAVSISGHPEYCPEPVSARLLEHGLIGRGKHLKFLLNDSQPITTTRVVHLRVDRPKPAVNPPSIH